MRMRNSDPLRFRLCALAVIGAALAHAAPASAQAENEAAARALFIDGRQLMKAHRYDEACGKFEAARALYTSPGLLLNLANCYDLTHRTASAWTEFGDAADAAARSGRQGDEAEAKRRQAEVQKKLSLLSVTVEGATEDEHVTRDGVLLARSAWGSSIPVDSGSHTIAAEAAGRRPWSMSVEVEQPGKTVTVSVPPLEDMRGQATAATPSSVAAAASANASATDAPAPPPATRGQGQRIAGWALGGVGVLTLGASGVLAIVARSRFTSAENESVGRRADSMQAVRLADVVTGTVIAGGVLTAAGLVVWLTAPSAHVAVGARGSVLFVAGQLP